jgi:lysophospholipid acyltransferase (LPLAT)-like uncharacterized protein
VIVPLHAESSQAWRLHSWDRMIIPRPFARVWITYGQPFEVAPGDDGFAEGVERAVAGLNRVSRNGAWRDEVIAIG